MNIDLSILTKATLESMVKDYAQRIHDAKCSDDVSAEEIDAMREVLAAIVNQIWVMSSSFWGTK